MINPQNILDASNGGLDIILSYYPQARDSVGTKKPFHLRNEKTPSAFIRQFGTQWKVTDFGDDAHARSCFDIVMQEENIKFYEALCLLADRFGVSKQLDKTLNKPDIKQRDPEPDETEGHFGIEFNDKWTPEELALFGHKVTQDNVDKLSYRSVKWYSRTKRNEKTKKLETTVISSNENYGIFARECDFVKKDKSTETFLKIYQPQNTDKAFRFFYQGAKPKDYVNGLLELKRAYTRLNEQDRSIWENNPENEGKPYKDKKLDAAVICSGERDAVNCLSYGYAPLWLNSESATLEEKDYREIMKLTEKLYNIPDIDNTGKRKGVQLGLKYLDVHTVKLPEWLGTYKDMRGKPRKDLRDFLEIRRERRDFEDLIQRAMPYKFWEWVTNQKGAKNLEINTAYMLNFLSDVGFGKLQDPQTKKETLIQVTDNVVKEVTSKDIRAYLVDFVRKNVADIKVVNLVLNSARTKTVTMDDLNKLDIDFSDNEEFKQYMFFQNRTIEVNDKEIKEYRNGDLDHYVWEHRISEHNFKRIDPAFKISREADNFDIDILHSRSHFFRYLINASRTFWRTELEARATDEPETEAEYYKENKFKIDGPRLMPEQIHEQEQNLISKIFAIGYMLHRYKALSKAWAVWVMEDKVSDDGQSLGGTGKSFMIKFLSNFKNTVTFGGRNKKLTENVHIFERVNRETDLLFIDDADQYLDFNFFYGSITGDMDINEKHVKSQSLSYEESPKMAITSNFAPRNNDSSTSRRLLYVVFSDWYHEANEDNDYKETRTIRDDFGYDICKQGYKPEYWNEDINFLMDCLHFYLSVSADHVKLQPPMHKVYERMNISTMGSQFRDWAEVYFSPEGLNVDKELIKEQVIKDFMSDTMVKNWSTKQFTKALKAFCKNTEYIYEMNPKMLQNSGNRIVRNIQGKTTEMIYIRTYDYMTNSVRPTNTDTAPVTLTKPTNGPF